MSDPAHRAPHVTAENHCRKGGMGKPRLPIMLSYARDKPHMGKSRRAGTHATRRHFFFGTVTTRAWAN